MLSACFHAVRRYDLESDLHQNRSRLNTTITPFSALMARRGALRPSSDVPNGSVEVGCIGRRRTAMLSRGVMRTVCCSYAEPSHIRRLPADDALEDEERLHDAGDRLPRPDRDGLRGALVFVPEAFGVRVVVPEDLRSATLPTRAAAAGVPKIGVALGAQIVFGPTAGALDYARWMRLFSRMCTRCALPMRLSIELILTVDSAYWINYILSSSRRGRRLSRGTPNSSQHAMGAATGANLFPLPFFRLRLGLEVFLFRRFSL